VRFFLVLSGIILFVTDLSGQSDTLRHKSDTIPDRFYLLQKVKRDGVEMPEVEIKEVLVLAEPFPGRKSEFRKYERLVSNIKRVYPYALMVRSRLNQVNEDLKRITIEKERKEYIKKVEKSVFAEYEGDIQQMTITQGRLLIKLIDRETMNTSYDLIRQYRGRFSAAFWQGIARIFGTNLKEEYDASGDDALIEMIIRDVDAGLL
jgi:hypothetical protein